MQRKGRRAYRSNEREMGTVRQIEKGVNKTEMKEKYEKEATRALAEREGEREGKKQSKDTAEERGTERNPEKEESADFSTRG